MTSRRRPDGQVDGVGSGAGGRSAAECSVRGGGAKKVLMNVTVERSLGRVQVVMSPESRVEDLIKAVIEIYVKEKMRPLLSETDPRCFELHYSQFSFESLNPIKELKDTESRNFFLCAKTEPIDSSNVKSPELGKEKKLSKWPSTLTKFMDFLL